MLRELFVNVAILISFIFMASIYVKDIPISHKSSAKVKYALGAFNSILGMLLMVYSLNSNFITLVDLKFIPIVIVAFLVGMFPAIFCAIIISLFKLIYFGMNAHFLVGTLIMIFIAIGCGFISTVQLAEWKKWCLMIVYSIILITIRFGALFKNDHQYYIIVCNFWIASILASCAVFFAIQYVIESNSLFRKLKEQSTKDFLTGLSNPRQFNTSFNTLISQVGNDIKRFSILIIDVDFFKRINDTYGHPGGDAILKQLALILCNSCRAQDIISRLGGEEFSILLPNCDYVQAFVVAERIRKTVKVHRFLLPNGLDIKCTISIGVATYPDTVKNPDMLISKADEALYKAKELGRDKVYCIGEQCNTMK
jgi:diguanylate cyclase